jgi:antitoxin (DNA-binding transcriptional repressor) of toxin-antitoxin stability system
MVKQVNTHEAKTNFFEFAQRVVAGEEVLIARDGKVIMKLSRFEEELLAPKDFSSLRGLISPISDKEWDRMDREFLDSI